MTRITFISSCTRNENFRSWRKFEDVVKSAQDAAVLVMVY